MSTTENSHVRNIDNNTSADNSEDDFMSSIDDNYPGPIVSRIEELILKNGIPKRQVRRTIVEITGITKSALVKWFSGDTTHPALQHLILISDFYNTSLEWLAKGNNDINKESPEALEIQDALGAAAPITFHSPVMHNLTINQQPVSPEEII